MANSLLLMGMFMIIELNKSAEFTIYLFEKYLPYMKPFRDGSRTTKSTYDCTIKSCWLSVERAL